MHTHSLMFTSQRDKEKNESEVQQKKYRSKIRDAYLLNEGEAVVLIVKTHSSRAICIERIKEGNAIINALTVSGVTNFKLSSFLPDDRANYWESHDYGNAYAPAKQALNKYYENKIFYSSISIGSDKHSLEALEKFLNSFKGYVLTAEIDETIERSYKSAFGEALNLYQERVREENTCNLF